MENKKTRSPEEVKELMSKVLPFVAIGLLVLGIALSFALPFYEIKEVQSEVKVKTAIQFHQVLMGQYGNVPTQIFYWVNYVGLPVIALGLILFARKFRSLNMGAMLILLLCGSTAIVSKDVLTYVLGEILGQSAEVNKALVGSIIPTVAFFVAAAALLVGQNSVEDFSVSDITEAGMLVALAFILNFVTLYKMPTGGSVNLQIFPLILFSLRRGPVKGFVVSGIIYGLLTCLTDGYGLATFPFDYLIAFGSCGLAGFFSPLIFGKGQTNYNLKGEIFLFVAILLATSVRFVGSSISSMILYGLNIDEAAIYNLGYVFISGGIAAGIIMALYGPLARVNAQFPVKKVMPASAKSPAEEVPTEETPSEEDEQGNS